MPTESRFRLKSDKNDNYIGPAYRQLFLATTGLY